MKWSVGVEAEADQVLSREQVVELADAVAAYSGIATGIGTNRYGAQLIVEAGDRDDAIERARETFTQAAATAGLPRAPIVRVEAISEEEDEPFSEEEDEPFSEAAAEAFTEAKAKAKPEAKAEDEAG